MTLSNALDFLPELNKKGLPFKALLYRNKNLDFICHTEEDIECDNVIFCLCKYVVQFCKKNTLFLSHN